MLSGAFISAVLGYELTEEKIVYLSQTLDFAAPVYICDIITTTATVNAIRQGKNIVTMDTACTNQDGESVVMIMP